MWLAHDVCASVLETPCRHHELSGLPHPCICRHKNPESVARACVRAVGDVLRKGHGPAVEHCEALGDYATPFRALARAAVVDAMQPYETLGIAHSRASYRVLDMVSRTAYLPAEKLASVLALKRSEIRLMELVHGQITRGR